MGNRSVGFDLAQQIHDAIQPPEEPYCHHCDNSGEVEAIAFRDPDGREYFFEGNNPTIPCPCCQLESEVIVPGPHGVGHRERGQRPQLRLMTLEELVDLLAGEGT